MAQDLQADSNLKVFNEALPFAQSWDMVKGAEVRKLFNDLINQAASSQSSLVQTQTDIQTLINNKGKI
jgi:hypothetical protein